MLWCSWSHLTFFFPSPIPPLPLSWTIAVQWQINAVLCWMKISTIQKCFKFTLREFSFVNVLDVTTMLTALVFGIDLEVFLSFRLCGENFQIEKCWKLFSFLFFGFCRELEIIEILWNITAEFSASSVGISLKLYNSFQRNLSIYSEIEDETVKFSKPLRFLKNSWNFKKPYNSLKH